MKDPLPPEATRYAIQPGSNLIEPGGSLSLTFYVNAAPRRVWCVIQSSADETDNCSGFGHSECGKYGGNTRALDGSDPDRLLLTIQNVE